MAGVRIENAGRLKTLLLLLQTAQLFDWDHRMWSGGIAAKNVANTVLGAVGAAA